VTLRELLDSVSEDIDAGALTDQPVREATIRINAGRARYPLPTRAHHYLKVAEP
jgi:hypothetical protein